MIVDNHAYAVRTDVLIKGNKISGNSVEMFPLPSMRTIDCEANSFVLSLVRGMDTCSKLN